MSKIEVVRRTPGTVVIVDVLEDLDDVGVASTLYITRINEDGELEYKFYEYVNNEYTEIEFTSSEDIEVTLDELRKEVLEEAQSYVDTHEEKTVSVNEVHGLRIHEDNLQWLNTDGEWVDLETAGTEPEEPQKPGVDLVEVKKMIEEAIAIHEDKTIYRDKVHGLEIDGGIMGYWDHNKEEWVDLQGSEHQTLPRVSNFLVVADEKGDTLLGSWTNPKSPTYKRTEIYVSTKDITTAEREEVIANADRLINNNTANTFEYGAELGKMYYFVAYAIHDIEGEEQPSSPRTAAVHAWDITPPGDVTDIKVTPSNEALSVSWTNPTDSDLAKIRLVIHEEHHPLDEDDGDVAYEGMEQSAFITGLENGKTYYLRFYVYDLNGNINNSPSMTAEGTPNDAPPSGPGGSELIAGDLERGFYGEVPSSEMISGEELAKLVGVTQGSLQNSDTPWLKWAYKGKTLFRPKKPIRYSISWDHLNSKDLVYGDRTIEVNGNQYKIRLMKSVAEGYETAEANFKKTVPNSEWNHLMLPIHKQAKDASWSYPQYVEDDVPCWGIDYTDADLGIGSGINGRCQWCQEHNSSGSSYRVSRGCAYGVSLANYNISSNTYSYMGWAPVLELL